MNLCRRSGDIRIVIVPHQNVQLLAVACSGRVHVGRGGYARLHHIIQGKTAGTLRPYPNSISQIATFAVPAQHAEETEDIEHRLIDAVRSELAKSREGRLILELCEAAARAEGFSRLELMATLSGRPRATARVAKL